jgi:3-oxoadipate enol-lactonase
VPDLQPAAPGASVVAPPRLHDSGAGPALVLLHAFPQDASMWDHQVAALSGRARCVRSDAPGCGPSPQVAPPAPGTLTLDGLAAALLNALDAAGVAQFALAGLSMGGYLAFAVLRAAPTRVTALALLATRAAADTDAVRQTRLAMVERLRRDGQAARDAEIEPTVERLLSPRARGEFHISDPVRGRARQCSPEGMAACQEAMAARPDSTPLLSHIAVPTLVVAGELDAVVPVDEMRGIAAAVHDATFEVVAGAGHLVNLERPEAISGLLARWLDRTAPVSAAWP